MKINQRITCKLRQFLACCLFSVICSLFLVGCQSSPLPEGLLVKVVEVWDGRDIEVTDVDSASAITERVRLEGIAVPDLGQEPWGNAAKAELVSLIGNQPVIVESAAESRDRTGRRLAYLWHNHTLINEKLVAHGVALFTTHLPNTKYDQRLARAQDRARALGLGIWNTQRPLREIKGEK
jgi:micrococcal nuclease